MCGCGHGARPFWARTRRNPRVCGSGLAAGDGADDQEGFFAGNDLGGQCEVGSFVGEIFGAGEEAQEGAALQRVMVADGAAQHGIGRLEGIQDRAKCGWTLDGKGDLAGNMGEGPEMVRKYNANHGGILTSREQQAAQNAVTISSGAEAHKNKTLIIGSEAPTPKDHGKACTSTERTAGRSRTMGFQESPASEEAYTWPPVVPK